MRPLLPRTVIEPYHKGKAFLCGGTIVDPYDIETIHINKTDQPSSFFLPKIRADLNSSKFDAPTLADEQYVTKEGADVTRDFINFGPGSEAGREKDTDGSFHKHSRTCRFRGPSSDEPARIVKDSESLDLAK